MPEIPRDSSLDSSIPFMRDPYGFIAKRCRRFGADLFRTRLLLQETICMTGPEAAGLFYDTSRFYRHGAPPMRVQKTLFGVGGIQGMDDEAHRHRKAMLVSTLMDPQGVAGMVATTHDVWRRCAAQWALQDRVVLYDAVREVLTQAVCAWAGVPLEESEVDMRTRQLTALFDAAGDIGPRHWWARVQRQRGDRWAAEVIERVRNGSIASPDGSPVQVIAEHRDLDGQPLPPRVAGVELLNVLRPTVAISVWITFIAHALHEHPPWRERLAGNDGAEAEFFVQEVRRFYPFFPSVIARVRDDFEWNGYTFPKDTRVVLDLYGTDHDPRTWDAPGTFRPERFANWDGGRFNFIPQGGGDYEHNHRCPGEMITVEVMKLATRFLTREMRYDLAPDQDLSIDMGRLPALPSSKVVIQNVRLQTSIHRRDAENAEKGRNHR